MQAIRRETVERGVVQHDDRVCVLNQAARCGDRIVRLHDDVGAAVLRGEEEKEGVRGWETRNTSG